MFISEKRLCLLLIAIGSVLADANDECGLFNTLLGREESNLCCSEGYPLIKCSKEHITYINLSNKEINKELPSTFGNLPKLSVLNLSNNNITGSLPDDFENLEELFELNLSSNEITGGISKNITKLKNLKALNLSKNKISSIPKEIASLPLLTDLDLSDNEIETQLISLIEGENVFSSLRNLNLSNNKVNGTIPTEISIISNLVSLKLSNNELEGSIPSTIGDLSKLKFLYLNNNKLSGEIPTTSLVKLIMTEIDLSENIEISGKIPKLMYNAEEHICNYNNTSLCYIKKDDNLCKYTDYVCSSCVENAYKGSDNVCRCIENYSGIGYSSCYDIKDNNLEKENENGVNARASFKSLTIATIIIFASYLLNYM